MASECSFRSKVLGLHTLTCVVACLAVSPEGRGGGPSFLEFSGAPGAAGAIPGLHSRITGVFKMPVPGPHLDWCQGPSVLEGAGLAVPGGLPSGPRPA